MGTKNNPGDFDCYANAAPDEPMFVLLARDKHAPFLVWLWTILREIDGESPEKIEEARRCVQAMSVWRREDGRPILDIRQLRGILDAAMRPMPGEQ